MNAVILLVVLASAHTIFCFPQTIRKPRCSDCPKSSYPCDEVVRSDRGYCYCSTCITKCSLRYNRCDAGFVCKEVPFALNSQVMVANCTPFESCSNETCDVQCPVSGYFVDKNNCTACLCNSPCLEFCPPEFCFMWTTNTYAEPHYECTYRPDENTESSPKPAIGSLEQQKVVKF